MLWIGDSSMLLRARCRISGVGVCERMCSGQYVLSLSTVYAAMNDELLCEVKVLQSFIGFGYGWCDMKGIVMCIWLKKCQNIGMGVRKGTVVLFVSALFGCFLGIPSLCLFIFLNGRVVRARHVSSERHNRNVTGKRINACSDCQPLPLSCAPPTILVVS